MMMSIIEGGNPNLTTEHTSLESIPALPIKCMLTGGDKLSFDFIDFVGIGLHGGPVLVSSFDTVWMGRPVYYQ